MENATLAQVPLTASLSASSPETLAKIFAFEDLLRTVEQVDVVTEHLFHGGMYSRTIRIPENCVITGALVKVPTLLVVHGDADVLAGDSWAHISGFGVLAGSAFRKQVLVARSAVEMTMVFPTQAQSVEEVERELTDEYEKLMSRKAIGDKFLVTGE